MFQRYSPSLRFRFLTALCAALILALLALAGVSKWLILPALLVEERSVVEQELDRLERSLKLEEQDLLAKVRDWATWDDTYDFINGDAPRYSEVNFSQQMFEDMRYQLMAFFNARGDIHFLAGLNPSSGQYQTCADLANECAWMAPLVASMQASINEDPEQEKTALYAHIPPAIVASAPILRTDGSGPPTGWLFKVRKMDNDWLALIEDYTGLIISLDVVDETKLTQTDLLRFSNTIHAQRFLPLNRPDRQLALGARLDRSRYFASLDTFRYVLLWTFGLMLIVIGLVLLLLERMVLRPLKSLARFAQDANIESLTNNPLTQRRDEIGQLAQSFLKQFERQAELTAELTELSTHDPLTGLANRRLFDKNLIDATQEALNQSTPMAVMMIDIDYFKLFNDHYGHLEGDTCLQRIADTMYEVAQTHGFFIARTGGEEFSALLPNTSLQQAIKLGQAISDAVDALAYPHHMSPLAPHVTLSVGVSALDPEEPANASSLMRSADQALYQAKAAGRHRVSQFNSPLASAEVSTHNTPP